MHTYSELKSGIFKKPHTKLVGQNKGFEVFFNPSDQTYSVYKGDRFVIGNKYNFSDVKCYID